MNDLLEKLKNLGLNIDLGADKLQLRKKGVSIEEIVDGEWIESKNQRFLIFNKSIPFGHKHGKVIFNSETDIVFQDTFWGIEKISNYLLEDFIFIDTETSNLSVGAGSMVFLFGGCSFTDDSLEISQFFIDDPSSESFFLAYLDVFLQKFKCLVTYNGKSFDLPILKSRFIIQRMDHFLNKIDHIDLLHKSRSLWKYQFGGKKLSDIEEKILDFERNENEVPGWLIPQIYQDYQVSGDAGPLKGVFYHNEIDVVSLAALFININHILQTENFTLEECFSLGDFFFKSGKYKKAIEYYKIAYDKCDKKEDHSKIAFNLAMVLKKQKNFNDAIQYWMTSAKMGNFQACVELAKYNEHNAKDIITALKWTRKAKDLFIKEFPLSNKILSGLDHRLLRLIKKSGKK